MVSPNYVTLLSIGGEGDDFTLVLPRPLPTRKIEFLVRCNACVHACICPVACSCARAQELLHMSPPHLRTCNHTLNTHTHA